MSKPTKQEVAAMADFMMEVLKLAEQSKLTPILAIKTFGALTRWLANNEVQSSGKDQAQVFTEAIGEFTQGFGAKLVPMGQLGDFLEGRDQDAPLQ